MLLVVLWVAAYKPASLVTYDMWVLTSFLLQLREIAPEFYTPLQCHTSWCWVIWKFLSDPAVGPWTRMKRETREGTDGGQEPIALHTKTAFADITNLPTSPAGKAVKAA